MIDAEDDTEDDTEDDWVDYESGPFCRHFSDPSDCKEKCANCGEPCTDHGDSECEWKDGEDE